MDGDVWRYTNPMTTIGEGHFESSGNAWSEPEGALAPERVRLIK